MKRKAHYFDSVVIVTGAASGIGRELTRRLATSGARVHAVDINEEGLLGTKQRLGRDDVSIQIHRLDVSDASAIQDVCEQVAREHGRIDYVFKYIIFY